MEYWPRTTFVLGTKLRFPESGKVCDSDVSTGKCICNLTAVNRTKPNPG